MAPGWGPQNPGWGPKNPVHCYSNVEGGETGR